MVSSTQLEEKYGGKVKDRSSGQYWPPSCPSDDYGVGQITDVKDSDLNDDGGVLINEADKEEGSQVAELDEK